MQRAPGHPVLLIVAALMLIVPGCGGGDTAETPVSGPATGDTPPVAVTPAVASRPVLLLDIVERHTDDFDEPLADVARPVTVEPPFTFDGGRLQLDTDLLDQLDAEALAVRNLVLGSADTPLGRCKLLVRRIIRYDGQGRTGGHIHYEAHPGLPAEITIPPGLAPGTERIEIDPAGGSLYTAALTVRLLGGGGLMELEQAGAAGALIVTFGSRTATVAAGDASSVHDEQRSVTLNRAALTAGMVEMDPAEGPVPDDPDEVLLPAESYGSVSFSTEIIVRYHGTVPAESSGRAGS